MYAYVTAALQGEKYDPLAQHFMCYPSRIRVDGRFNDRGRGGGRHEAKLFRRGTRLSSSESTCRHDTYEVAADQSV